MTATTYQLLESGKSAELAAALRLVAEAEVLGEPKFSPRVQQELETLIVCRNYAPVLHELCHLLQVADHCGRRPDRVEHFFWGAGPARPSLFRGLVEQALPSDRLSLTDNGVALAYEDSPFAISFGRMPLLSAMLEFLVTTLGYLAVDDLVQGLREGGFSKAATSAQSKQLAKNVYAYLGEHLPTAQEQRKLHRLLQFMTRHRPGGFDQHAIDDDGILHFWQEESLATSSDGLDFRTYSTVYQLFVDFRQVLESLTEAEGLHAPLPLGGDREAGEIDPAAIQQQLESIDRQTLDLGWLGEEPVARIKFLNKREQEDLQQLVNSGAAARPLALSLLRVEIFGKGQSRITQALRRKVSADELADLVSTPTSEDYAERQAALARVEEHLRKVLQAALHVLLRNESDQVAALFPALAASLDLSPLRQLWPSSHADSNVVPLGSATVGRRLSALLADPTVVGKELAALTESADKAYKGLSRQGFRDDEINNPEVVAGFEQAVTPLLGLAGQLQEFLTTLADKAPTSGWGGQFAVDAQVFTEQFSRLYLDIGRKEACPS